MMIQTPERREALCERSANSQIFPRYLVYNLLSLFLNHPYCRILRRILTMRMPYLMLNWYRPAVREPISVRLDFILHSFVLVCNLPDIYIALKIAMGLDASENVKQYSTCYNL